MLPHLGAVTTSLLARPQFGAQLSWFLLEDTYVIYGAGWCMPGSRDTRSPLPRRRGPLKNSLPTLLADPPKGVGLWGSSV